MKFLILQTATKFLMPLLLLFSIFILIKGHNEPGGGFVGGLIAASAFALHAFAYNVESTRNLLRITPHTLIGSGLLLSLLSSTLSLLTHQPFMTGIWIQLEVLEIGTIDLGTPLFFDFGVYLLVLGISLMILLSIAEE